jgi:hypothetical protein
MELRRVNPQLPLVPLTQILPSSLIASHAYITPPPELGASLDRPLSGITWANFGELLF